MSEAYIVDAVRTPVGKRNGGLAKVHPADLGAHSIRALFDRVDVDPAAVDDVVFGCVDTIGPQAGDIARTCWLVAGLPDEVPGTTVDRQCGSSQQAVHFAAQARDVGHRRPRRRRRRAEHERDPDQRRDARRRAVRLREPVLAVHRAGRRATATQEVSQFRSAEMIAEKWNITRDDMEAFAVESHERAFRARAEGRFDKRDRPARATSTTTKGPREPNLDKIRSLPTLVEGGRLTAAMASQLSDASAALLDRERRRGAHARPHAPGPHPPPLGARRRPGVDAHRADPGDRARAGEDRHDASTTSTSSRSTRRSRRWCSPGRRRPDADLAKVNVNGGAIALGHPLGATGARLMTTLLHELERTGGRYGLQTMCEGGGQANVTIIERL